MSWRRRRRPRDKREEAWVVAGVRWTKKIEISAPWAERREKKEGGKGRTS